MVYLNKINSMCIQIKKDDDSTYEIDPEKGRLTLYSFKENDFVFCPKCNSIQRGTITNMCWNQLFRCAHCNQIWVSKNGEPIADVVFKKHGSMPCYTFRSSKGDTFTVKARRKFPARVSLSQNKYGEVARTVNLFFFYNPSS